MFKWFSSVFLCSIIGYLVGGLNPAFLLAKLKGFDIRTKGSGNAGASNAVITMGKPVGALCAIFDIFKAYFVVKLSIRMFPMLRIAGTLSGTACILGHIFPVAMKFRGGKGLASLGGVILAYDKKLFLIVLLAEIVLVLITDYICFVATSASLIFMLILLIHEALQAFLFLPVVCAIFKRHHENFLRIHYGVEAKFSALWNKEAEQTRVCTNWLNLSEEERQIVDMPAPVID